MNNFKTKPRGHYFPQQRINEIVETANQVINAGPVEWKQDFNQMFGAYRDGNQIHFKNRGMIFSFLKDQRKDLIIVFLYQGETANVCVDLDGNICHMLGGRLI